MSKGALQGKTALVTGGARRIGRAISLALADEGANIVVHHRSAREEALELEGLLAAKGVRAWLIRADFARREEYEGLVTRARDLAGGLDILVNSASIFPTDTLDTVDLAGLMQNIEVNAWVPFVLGREFARAVGRGKIINLIDSRVRGYDWNHVGYILSKHVLRALTRMMAVQYAPDITVNGVGPGLVLPPPGAAHEYIDGMARTVPLKRHGQAEDVAEAVAYLAKAEFVTGTVIYVDGGRHLMEYARGPHPD